jgi:hypothetical protein
MASKLLIFGGADRDRTDDLLNAIIPNLFRASRSRKKYLALLTADNYQIFTALEVLSQKIRTAARGPLAF